MNSGDIVGLVAVIAIFLIPSIGLTARFALKPIVESVLRLRDALDRERGTLEDPRVPQLLQDVSELRESVERLTAAVDFDTQLRASATGTAPQLPGGKA